MERYQASSNPAFAWIAYISFSFIFFSDEYGGMRRTLKHVAAVGSLSSGLLPSNFEMVNLGCMEEKPIRG